MAQHGCAEAGRRERLGLVFAACMWWFRWVVGLLQLVALRRRRRWYSVVGGSGASLRLGLGTAVGDGFWRWWVGPSAY
jgi:hypothetical protein